MFSNQIENRQFANDMIDGIDVGVAVTKNDRVSEKQSIEFRSFSCNVLRTHIRNFTQTIYNLQNYKIRKTFSKIDG